MGIRVDAEALLRQGKAGAGDLVTQVRARNFKGNPSKATVTDDELKANSSYKYGSYAEDYGKTMTAGDTTPIQFGRMYQEYQWEFAWEFGIRSHCVRFGVFTKKNWLSHEAKGEGVSMFPIPEKALTSNPNLHQNPNYK